jgi:threonine dehydrogenase-like Zn-dependent dehydrogenase
LYLSDVIPTAWQAVEYASVPAGGSLLVIGLGPIGHMSCRVARQRGVERIFGIDPVPERRARAAAYGIEVFDFGEDGQRAITEATDGRGPDSVIDAVGMEAHGSPLASFAHAMTGLLQAVVAESMMENAFAGSTTSCPCSSTKPTRWAPNRSRPPTCRSPRPHMPTPCSRRRRTGR